MSGALQAYIYEDLKMHVCACMADLLAKLGAQTIARSARRCLDLLASCSVHPMAVAGRSRMQKQIQRAANAGPDDPSQEDPADSVRCITTPRQVHVRFTVSHLHPV